MAEKNNPEELETPVEQALNIVHAKEVDERYLKIWSAELEHTKTRWTVLTFFFSVSFAIFGFSFQGQLAKPLANVARISALIIYWFAYLLYSRFNQYTKFLREYLKELEDLEQTSLKLQTRFLQKTKSQSHRRISATKLLIYFGILYTGAVITLWLFRY